MIEAEFKAALNRAGLSTKDRIISDGRLHRFRVEGDKPGSKNGWYVLHAEDIPAGAFGCWKRDVSKTWCAKSFKTLSRSEKRAFQRRIAEINKARAYEEQSRRKEARDKAAFIWKNASPAPHDHPYLIKKQVLNHGLKIHRGCLVISMRDSADTMHSLQFIDHDGNKRFLSGGRKQGCYFLIEGNDSSLLIAEGYRQRL